MFSVVGLGSLGGARSPRGESRRGSASARRSIVATLVFGPAMLLIAVAPDVDRRTRSSSRRARSSGTSGVDLQHRPGQLPPGDLPAAAPGSDELGHALHRLGHDPDRHARRRRARHLDRASPDAGHRCDRRRASRSSGSCSRRNASCARCPSRSRTNRSPTSSARHCRASPIRSPPSTRPDVRLWPTRRPLAPPATS